MTIWLLLALLGHIFALPLMLASVNYTGRYDAIYYPVGQSRAVFGNVFDYNVILSPLLPITQDNLLTGIEACSASKASIPKGFTTCENYFCSPTIPTYLNTTPQNIRRHWDVLTYCSLCSATGAQGFTLVDLNETRCPWVNLNYSCPQGVQTNESICVPYVTSSSMIHFQPMYYYPADQKFYAVKDYIHTTFIPAIDLGVPYLFTILYFILLVFTLIFGVIPEFITVIWATQKDWRSKNVCHHLGVIFGFRTQSYFWLMISEILGFLFFFVYSVGTAAGTRYKTQLVLGLIICLTTALLSYISLISLWTYILIQTESKEMVRNPTTWYHKLILIIMYVFMLLFCFVGDLLRGLIPQAPQAAVGYGVWCILLLFVILALGTSFIIVGMILYISIKRKFASVGDNDVSFAKLRFTRIMFGINLVLLSFAIYLIWFIIVNYGGLDLTTTVVLLLSDIFLYVWLLVWNFLMLVIIWPVSFYSWVWGKIKPVKN
jgi:hypothetical protein